MAPFITKGATWRLAKLQRRPQAAITQDCRVSTVWTWPDKPGGHPAEVMRQGTHGHVWAVKMSPDGNIWGAAVRNPGNFHGVSAGDTYARAKVGRRYPARSVLKEALPTPPGRLKFAPYLGHRVELTISGDIAERKVTAPRRKTT